MPIANVEIISKETIKPSLPTPNDLSVHKLCVLDQLIPAEEAPIVIFYPNDNGSSHLEVFERLASLKNSLSETLTKYYPLAGSIAEDDISIECNDRGARFITAEVKHMSLEEFLRNPNLKFINRLLPTKGRLNGDGSHYLTNVQANVFACGGITVAACITHRVLDGTALSVFLKSWAAENNSGCDETLISPDFSASSLFPSGDSKLKEASMKMWLSLFKKGKFVTQRFVFESSAISKLKDMAKGDDTNNPTRVESVSAFISKCFLDSLQGNPRSENPSLVTHVVNLRKRASPNLPESSLGNLIWMASSKHYSRAEESLELSHLSGEIRRSISKIDGDYVKKLMSDEGKNAMIKYLKEIEGIGANGANQLGFTSWCKLGFYDVDFGWGRPIWVSSIDVNAPFFMNLVVLMDTRYGEGIEAWVTMDEQDVARLESNQQFMRFASCNPSPLRISK